MQKAIGFILVAFVLFAAECTTPTLASSQPSSPNQHSETSTSQVTPTATDALVLRLGHVDAESTSYHRALTRLSDNLKEATGGKLILEVHPNSLLGNERDLLEGMQLGTVDMSATATAPIANFVKKFTILDAPFLYRDDAHAYNVVNGEVGEYLNGKLLNEQGIRVLGYQTVGYRQIFSNRPVRTIDDLKGLKIRTMENSLHIATFQALEAQPTPMAYSEVFTSLQQKTIDAAENSLRNVVDMKFYEVARYISKTGHFYCLKPITIAEARWQKIPDEYKDIFKKLVTESCEWQWETAVRENKEAQKTLEDNGCEVYEFDIEALSEKIKDVYGEFPEQLPSDKLEIIRNTAS